MPKSHSTREYRQTMATNRQSTSSESDDPVLRISPLTLLGRALGRKCPICGSGRIWNSWIEIKEECPNCHYHYMRENGYFLGAMVLNVIFAEFLVMALMVVLLIWTDMMWWRVELVIL